MANTKRSADDSGSAKNKNAVNQGDKKVKITHKGNDKDTGKGRGFGKSDDKSPIR
ncbi:MAG: hypothetical protein JWN78_2092 [Bacteroidota bacterium]|nr:hypothetical protein [Bacteroidota bacterium]